MKSSETQERLILCVSERGDDLGATHVLRRLALAWMPMLDGAVTGCGVDLGRPLAVFFAPVREIDCTQCQAMVMK